MTSYKCMGKGHKHNNEFFFYNNFIAALDGNRGYMNSSELIQACNQAKLHNYKIYNIVSV